MKLILSSEVFRSIVYSSSDIIKAITMFVALIFFSYLLPASEYGMIATYIALWGFLTFFIGHSTQSSFESYFLEAQKNNEMNELILSTVFLTIANVSILILLHIVFDFTFFQDIFGFTDIFWILLCSSTHSLYVVFLSFLHMGKSKKVYFWSSIFFSLASQVISVCFCFYYKSWRVVLVGQLVSLFCLVIYIFNSSWRINLFSRPKRAFLKYLKSFYYLGCKGFFSFIGLWGLTGVDRFLLNKFSTISETGLYSVAYQFTLAVPLVAFAINRAFMPKIYNKLSESAGDVNVIVKKYFVSCFIFFLIISVVSYFIIPHIITYTIDPRYLGSVKYLFWLLIGQYFYACYVVVATVINYHKKFELTSVSAFIALVVNIVLNILWINELGPVGAAVATAVSYLLLFVFVLFFSLRLLKSKKIQLS